MDGIYWILFMCGLPFIAILLMFIISRPTLKTFHDSNKNKVFKNIKTLD